MWQVAVPAALIVQGDKYLGVLQSTARVPERAQREPKHTRCVGISACLYLLLLLLRGELACGLRAYWMYPAYTRHC